MGKLAIKIEIKVELGLDEVIVALANDAWDYGHVPENRKEALSTIRGNLHDLGTQGMDEIEAIEAEWPLIAEMNDLPSFEEFKQICLDLFPELGE